MPDADAQIDLEVLSDQLAGLVVSELRQPDSDSIAMHFTNGAVLTFRSKGHGIVAISTKTRSRRRGSGEEPTPRQRQYLEFIKKYTHRFGVGPAETDIQRHFLVSAPSVNQMVRTLERRGFVTRSRDQWGQTVPRSIRVIWDG